jgi:hypothetical protein
MNLETIRTIWAMIGAVIVALNASWIPDIIKGVFEPEASELLFMAIGSLFSLWQMLKARRGGTPVEPEAYRTGQKSKIWYAINPFAKAA